MVELARSPARIPPEGALALIYDDPYLQGPKLFKQNCAGCHNFESHEVDDFIAWDKSLTKRENKSIDEASPWPAIINPKPSAPNLYGVGSYQRIVGFLSKQMITTRHYFGYEGSPFADGDMVNFVSEAIGEKMSDKEKLAAKDAIKTVSECALG